MCYALYTTSLHNYMTYIICNSMCVFVCLCLIGRPSKYLCVSCACLCITVFIAVCLCVSLCVCFQVSLRVFLFVLPYVFLNVFVIACLWDVSGKIKQTWSKINKKCSQNLWKLMLKSIRKASWERLRLQGRICMNRGSPNPRKSIKIWLPNRTKLVQKAIQKGRWKPLHIRIHFCIDFGCDFNWLFVPKSFKDLSKMKICIQHGFR